MLLDTSNIPSYKSHIFSLSFRSTMVIVNRYLYLHAYLMDQKKLKIKLNLSYEVLVRAFICSSNRLFMRTPFKALLAVSRFFSLKINNNKNCCRR